MADISGFLALQRHLVRVLLRHVAVAAGGTETNTFGIAFTRQPPPSGMAPWVNLVPQDVEGLGAQLVAYHALFAPLFVREEQRVWALKYSQEQMLDIERKSVEPMALALEGGNVQAMQQFISAGAWDDEPILEARQQLMAGTLGGMRLGY